MVAMILLLAITTIVAVAFAGTGVLSVPQPTVTISGNGIVSTVINNVTAIAVNSALQPLIQQAIDGNFAANPTSRIISTGMNDVDIFNELNNGTVDMGVTTTPLSPAQMILAPDLMTYPIATSPIVPIYNIFVSPANTQPQLTLNAAALCGIFNGAIFWWNDTRILSINPGLTVPSKPIVVVASAVLTDNIATVFAAYCRKVTQGFTVNSTLMWPASYNATFNYTVGVNQTLPYTYSSKSFIITDPTVDIVRTIIQTPYSIAFTTFQKVAPIIAQGGLISVANMWDINNATVSVSTTTVHTATEQLAIRATASNNAALDLNAATTSQAWPINMPIYAIMARLFSRLTCSLRQQTVRFLFFLMTDPGVATEALNSNVVIFDSYVQAQQLVFARLYNDISCDTVQIFTLPRSNSDGGSLLLRSAVNVLTGDYANSASSATQQYMFQSTTAISTDALVHLSQAANPTLDFGVITQSDTLLALTNQNIYNYGQSVMIPFTLLATVPTFQFPAAVVATASNPTYLYPLYPFVLDTITLASIFLGEITSFVDPLILRFNPSLAERFNNTGSNTTITLVLCCTASSAPQPITNAFTYQLSEVDELFQTYALASRPTQWSDVFNHSGTTVVTQVNTTINVTTIVYINTTIYVNVTNSTANVNGATNSTAITNTTIAINVSVPTNVTTPINVTNYVLTRVFNQISYVIVQNEPLMGYVSASTPGSVSYALVTSSTVDDTFMIRIISPLVNPDDAAASISAMANNSMALQPTPSNIAACAPALEYGSLVLNMMSNSISQSCWPLTQVSALVIPANTSSMGVLGPLVNQRTDVCIRTTRTVSLLNWMTTSSQAARLIATSGQVQIATADADVASFIMSIINTIQCDGILITGSVVTQWALAGIIQSAVTIISAVFIGILGLSVVFTGSEFAYGRLPLTPAVTISVLNVGLLLLSASALQYVQTPQLESCQAFVCLLTFAATFVVSSIFILSQSTQIPSSKLNPLTRLSLVTAALLLLDVVVLSAWLTSSSAAVPEISQSVNNGGVTLYNQCTVTSSAVPYVVILAAVHAVFLGVVVWSALDIRSSIPRSVMSRNVNSAVLNIIIAMSIFSAVINLRKSNADELSMIVGIWALEIVFVTYTLVPLARLYQIQKADIETRAIAKRSLIMPLSN